MARDGRDALAFNPCRHGRDPRSAASVTVVSPGAADRAAELLERLREPLAPVEDAIRSHRFLAALAEGRAPRQALRALAGEQRHVIASDRRSFAQLAARFPQPPPGDFFLAMSQGEGEALGLLDGYIGWLELDEVWLRAYEPDPRAQSYPAYVAWLALNGGRSAVALAFLANLAAWGDNCAACATRTAQASTPRRSSSTSLPRRPGSASARWRWCGRASTRARTRSRRRARRACCRPTSCSSGTRWRNAAEGGRREQTPATYVSPLQPSARRRDCGSLLTTRS
jgi:thiaminase